MATGQPHQVDAECIRDDGSRFVARIHASPLFHPDGTVRGFNEAVEDITERKQTEEALQRSEEQHRLLIENSHDIIYTLNPEGLFTFVPPAWIIILGYSIEDALGKPFQSFVHPEDVGICESGLRQVLKSDQRHKGLEFRVKHANGTWRWFHANAVRLIDKTGAVIGMEGSAKDITARKKIEEALRESQEYTKILFDSSIIPHIVMDGETGVYTDCNEAAARIYGYAGREEVIGKTPYDVSYPTQYDGSSSAEAGRMRMKVCRAEGSCVFGWKHQRPNGQIWDATVHLMLFHYKGKPFMQFTLQDITEHKRVVEALRESEAKYRDLFENAVEGIYQTTPEGQYISANPALAHILGYESPADLMGDVSDIDRQIYVEPSRRQEFKYMLSEFGMVRNFEAHFRKRDKSLIWVSINANAIKDQEGNTVKYQGTMVDISEKKRMESQLQQDQKLKAIGTLAGGIAHDFNNLLMGIQGYAALIGMHLDPAHPHHAYLKGIEEQVANATYLTKQVLGFARGGRYEIKSTNMNEVIERVSSMFGRTKKQISMQKTYSQNLWLVDVDQGQMEQMLMNLYVNAWQAMPGGGELCQQTENVLLDDAEATCCAVTAGKYVKITVTDTGKGMDEATLERIFDPFFTTKGMGTEKRDGFGTGLGLRHCQGPQGCD